jgi:hypothetical protein
VNYKAFKLIKGLIERNKNKAVTPVLATQLGRAEGKGWKYDRGTSCNVS